MPTRPKVFCLIGSVLLVFMAAFHGSGYGFIRGAIRDSDAASFLKEIVPVLFVHPSYHLLGLAGFGILGLFLKEGNWKVWFLVAGLVLGDAGLGFAVGGPIPGGLLSLAALCFLIAGWMARRSRA